MKQKYMSNKMLQKLANELSKDAFKNPYPYDIFFDEDKNACFIPVEDIPVGYEDECFITIPKYMRKESTKTFLTCLIFCLTQYNNWWRGLDYIDQIQLSPEKLKHYVELFNSL